VKAMMTASILENRSKEKEEGKKRKIRKGKSKKNPENTVDGLRN